MKEKLNLLLDFIKDESTQQALENLQDYLDVQAFIKPEWQFFERDFAAAVTNERIKHTLGGLPKDIILTSKIGAGSVTFEYEDFTKDFIIVSTSGAAKIRFFVGTYVKGN